ncbi:MAG: hypothetical protein WC985_00310 [Thermoplasmata archaeon]
MPLVGCPVCGKWSSPKTFPAGPGNDLPLKVVRGLGRGKGFEVVGTGSGLNDRDLCLQVKEKLLSLATVLAAHGYLASREVEAALGKAGMSQDLDAAFTEVRKWKNRAAQLAKEKEHLEVELSSMERQLESEQEKVKRERRNREHLDVELSEARRALSQAEGKIDSLETQVQELRSEVAHWRSREDGTPSEEDEAGEEPEGSPDYAEVLRKLIRALDPLMDRVEYIGMDDTDVGRKVEAVQVALDEAREALGD